jgi:hypothetical protein
MFVRIYTGDDGKSHFEELDDREGSALFEKLQTATAVVIKKDDPARLKDWHPVPRRQYCITLGGAIDVQIGDGTVKTFGPGDVLLAEDVTGQGHTVVSKGVWTRMFVHLE